jgi:hypothetical protein
MSTIRDQIRELLDLAHKELKPRDRSNAGEQLYDIYFYQELCALAERRLKAAWAIAQSKAGLVETDEDLRSLGKGEHTVTESDKFRCLATVSEPRYNFSKELFLATAPKALKVKPSAVQKAMDGATAETKAPLHKRVVEA